jgi:hypothetical protein
MGFAGLISVPWAVEMFTINATGGFSATVMEVVADADFAGFPFPPLSVTVNSTFFIPTVSKV